jgi:hypothetical protein
MSNPSMVVRIAANLAELRANLAEGRNQIETTTAGMTRLAASFSGDRIVQAAHNVAAAVQQIGGVSKLTEAEQARVNRTVEAALQKYQALGQEAPQALRDLAAQTHQTEQKTSVLTQGVRLLVAAFSTRAIANAVKDAAAFGGQISDLAAKTGIGAEALQRLSFAAGQSGVPVEKLADGVVQLSRHLVGHDKAATEAVRALGLSVSNLIAQGPEAAFYAIGEAVAGIPNPMERAALATALFGRTGADFLPAFSSQMSEVAEQAQRAGLVLSTDTINGLDAADDSFAALKVSVIALTGQLLEPFLPAITAVSQWLGSAIPSSIKIAREAFRGLIERGMELNVWLLELAVSMAETAKAVPALGRVFGESAGSLNWLRESAQFAKDQLLMFRTEGVTPATTAVASAIPLTTTYGQEVEKAGKAAVASGRQIGIVWGEMGNITRYQIAGIISPALVEFKTDTDNAAEAMRDLLDEMARVEGRAITIGPVLANTMKLPWVEHKAAVRDSGTATDGFFAKVFGGAEGLSSSVSSFFQQAFVGGGGALGAVKGFATQTLSTMLGLIPGVGQWAQMFAGPIVEMFSKLAKKAADFFRGLFGGPNRDELNGRKLVEEFETHLAGLMTAQQRAEAGNDRWRQTVVVLRDAYLAMGLTEQEALRDAERLWASSRDGAEASRRVIEELQRKMQGAGAAAAAAVDDVTAAISRVPRRVDIEFHGTTTGTRGDGFAGGTISRGSWFRDFGPATLTVLHGREAVVREDQAVSFAQSVLGGGGIDYDQLAAALVRPLKRAFQEAMAGA